MMSCVLHASRHMLTLRAHDNLQCLTRDNDNYFEVVGYIVNLALLNEVHVTEWFNCHGGCFFSIKHNTGTYVKVSTIFSESE